MSNRLNQEREKLLQPKRMEAAIESISLLGFDIESHDETKIEFQFEGELIRYFPYSGWATGKTIKDGRGLQNLLEQLQKK